MAALAFGPIHNITTKTLELVQVCLYFLLNMLTLSVQPGEEEKGLLGKLLEHGRRVPKVYQSPKVYQRPKVY